MSKIEFARLVASRSVSRALLTQGASILQPTVVVLSGDLGLNCFGSNDGSNWTLITTWLGIFPGASSLTQVSGVTYKYVRFEIFPELIPDTPPSIVARAYVDMFGHDASAAAASGSSSGSHKPSPI